MKKSKLIILWAIILAVFLVIPISANEVSAVWTRLYKKATSLSQKYNIMENIVEQHSRDMIPVLEQALQEQVAHFSNTGDTTNRMENTKFTKLIVKELGRLKDHDAADLIWQVVENAKDPFLKGEAIIAEGRVGARKYVNKMDLMLRNLNLNFGKIQNQRDNEIIAYALVMALERLKQPESYTPLFFAAHGWYSRQSGVKEKAQAALLSIVDDPTKQLGEIITGTKEYNLKLEALIAGEKSKASADNKASLAVLALDQGLSHSPKDVIEKTQLKSLRIEALKVLEDGSSKPESAVPLMKSIIIGYQTERLYDEDEMLQLFETLGTYSSDSSAKIMASFLSYLTDRKESGGTVPYRISKALIIAMGNNGNKLGFEELARVQYSDAWENSIKREAKFALGKLKK